LPYISKGLLFAIIITTNVSMRSLIKLILINFVSFLLFSTNISFSQDQEVGEILENIQKDLKNSGVKVGPLHEHRDGTASFYMKDTEGNWLEMLYVPPQGIQSNV